MSCPAKQPPAVAVVRPLYCSTRTAQVCSIRKISCLQAKKLASHLKRHSGGHGYTNQDNPFGDSNVSERFVWGKKLEKQIQQGVDVRDLTARAEKRRQEDRLVRFCIPRACHCMQKQAAHDLTICMPKHCDLA